MLIKILKKNDRKKKSFLTNFFKKFLRKISYNIKISSNMTGY